jgi:hypothetical protein
MMHRNPVKNPFLFHSMRARRSPYSAHPFILTFFVLAAVLTVSWWSRSWEKDPDVLSVSLLGERPKDMVFRSSPGWIRDSEQEVSSSSFRKLLGPADNHISSVPMLAMQKINVLSFALIVLTRTGSFPTSSFIIASFHMPSR